MPSPICWDLISDTPGLPDLPPQAEPLSCHGAESASPTPLPFLTPYFAQRSLVFLISLNP